ncbi:helix-turn-helix domain-containing protein [Mangrovibacterium lignilyticum]|uniref:helix-turn-helix domain-containing protein n=1 Tax=Mangrovibacterium lignilyticum TaxID=2668052 RepID=UPI0013D3062B|nr:helix-turn-helix domain-containing protein [Mangrovibacterium lignilyticum]
MPSEILTTDDLREFKIELLSELKRLLKENQGLTSKKWLRSGEVRKLLGISPGTLQNMRVNGTLPFTKMGGVLYYDSQDIQKILESGKSQSQIGFGSR